MSYRVFESHCCQKFTHALLPDFIKLPGGLQQVELRLLALEIRIEVGHPLITFFETGFFDLTHVDSAFGELRLENGDILLRQLQLEASYFLGGIALAPTARFHADRGAHFRFLVGELCFGNFQIHLSERDIGFCLRAENGHIDLNASVEIVALKSLEKLIVIIEAAEQAVDANEFKGREVSAFFADETKLLGANI